MEKKLDKLLIIVSLIVVFIIVGCLYFMPESSQEIANKMFKLFTDVFGSLTLLFTFIGVILLAGISFSKFGRIK